MSHSKHKKTIINAKTLTILVDANVEIIITYLFIKLWTSFSLLKYLNEPFLFINPGKASNTKSQASNAFLPSMNLLNFSPCTPFQFFERDRYLLRQMALVPTCNILLLFITHIYFLISLDSIRWIRKPLRRLHGSLLSHLMKSWLMVFSWNETRVFSSSFLLVHFINLLSNFVNIFSFSFWCICSKHSLVANDSINSEK